MGRSVRSNRTKKNNRVKRVRYEQKALAKLKQVCAIEADYKKQGLLVPWHETVTPYNKSLRKKKEEIAPVRESRRDAHKKKVKDQVKELEATPSNNLEVLGASNEIMDLETEENKNYALTKERVFDKKTFKDEDGYYPKWMAVYKFREFKRENKMKRKCGIRFKPIKYNTMWRQLKKQYRSGPVIKKEKRQKPSYLV